MAHILILEDNRANLELAEYLLKAHGHRISAAANGRDGLASMRVQCPDLVICDLQMPVMDGYQFLSELKDTPAIRAVPVLAVTAFSMPGDRVKVLTEGFAGYISKPIDPEAFVGEVEAYLPPALRGRTPRPSS
jgi:CheY-like chemotaxis protein